MHISSQNYKSMVEVLFLTHLLIYKLNEISNKSGSLFYESADRYIKCANYFFVRIRGKFTIKSAFKNVNI